MKVNNFSEFSRQNPKGILLNYLMLLYRIIKSSWVLIPIFFTSKRDNFNYTFIYGSIAVLAVVLLVISILMYLNFKFKIKDNYFILKHGILNKTNTSIAFERIQNINFKQNIFQQILGVTQVEIETAGAKKTEVLIKALTKEKALALKESILEKKHEYLDKIQITEPAKKKYLIKLSLLQLAKVSISENHFKSLGIAIGLYISLTSQLGEYVKGWKFENLIDGGVDYISNNTETISNSFYIIGSLVLIGIIFSIIVSTVIVFLFHFNLTLSVKNGALEITQGLFTKRNNILKKEKVQYITLSANPLKKLMKINSIFFKQASSEGQKKKKQIRVVGSKKEQNEALKELLFNENNFDDLETYKPHNYYIYQITIRNLLFILLVNVAAYIFMYPNNSLYINILILPIVGLLSYYKYKKCYFKINKNMLIKGFGSLETHTTFFEYFKIQNIKLKQTIFQKRAGVMNLVLQTASGKIKIPCIPKEDAFVLYNHILKKSQTSRKSWI